MAGQVGRYGPLVTVTLDAPCDPYAPVTLRYGPLEVMEEASVDGRVTVTLPAMAPPAGIQATLSDDMIQLDVPAGDPARFASVVWTQGAEAAPAPGPGQQLVELGFPGGADRPADLVVASGDAPLALHLPLDDASCGRDLAAQVVTDAVPELRALTIAMPDCGGTMGTIVMPLGPS